MSEFPRILEEGGTEAELSMLRAAKAYRPDPQLRRSAMVALGLGSVLAVGKLGAAVSGAIQAFSAKGWLLLGIAAAAVAGGGALQYALSHQPASNVGAVRVVPPRPAEPVSKAGAASPAFELSDELPHEPMLIAAQPTPVAAEPTPSVAPARRLSRHGLLPSAENNALSSELKILDSVRADMRNGHSSHALQLLDDRDRRFGRGALLPEASVLRIEALLAIGDRPQAESLAQSFLSAHPYSVLSDRVRALLGTQVSTEPPTRR